MKDPLPSASGWVVLPMVATGTARENWPHEGETRMTSWSIDPAGTASILDDVEVALESFDGAGTAVNNAIDDLVAEMPDTMTASALETFGSDPMLIGLTSASEHAYSAVWGTRGAAQAYEDGQLTMAAEMEQSLAPRMAP